MSRSEKKRLVRDRLFNTALSLIRQHGYAHVSVAQITETAGVAKGTFFNHFPTKAHVIAAWYRAALSPPQDAVSFADALESVIEAAATIMEREPELFAAKVSLEASEPCIAEAEADSDERIAALFARTLEGRAPAGIAPRDIANLVLAALTGAARTWRRSARSCDARELFVRDLATLKKLILNCR